MGLIESCTEDFSVILPNGEEYGKVKGCKTTLQSMREEYTAFYTFSNGLNEFDIVRRCKDGKCYRLNQKACTGGDLNMFLVTDYTLFTTETE